MDRAPQCAGTGDGRRRLAMLFPVRLRRVLLRLARDLADLRRDHNPSTLRDIGGSTRLADEAQHGKRRWENAFHGDLDRPDTISVTPGSAAECRASTPELRPPILPRPS